MEAEKRAKRSKANTLYSLGNSPGHLLHRAQQRVADMTTQALRAYGLTPRQYAVLLALKDEKSLTQSSLVRETGIDRSTLADMLARMGKRGLTASHRTESDARANLVSITPQGERAVAAVTPKVVEAEQRMLSALPNPMRDTFVAALQEIAQFGTRK